MGKKIYASMLFLSITGILMVTVLFSAVFYFFYADQMKSQSPTEADYSVFLTLLPPVFLILLVITIFFHFYSTRLTKRIIAPINRLSLWGENDVAYEELTPFLQMISRQREQIQAQILALEERANTLQAIISDMREGLILLDAQGNIFSANASAATLLSEVKEALQGKNIVEVVRNKDFLENVRGALSGTAGDQTFTFGNKIVRVFFDPVIQSQKSPAILILFLDITESANAEKIRREFTANVSHELKTPLTVISGLSEMIELNKARPEDLAGFITKIREEAKRMTILIEDILKLSELDEENSQDALEAFDLCELAETAVASLLPLATEKEIRLDVSGQPTTVHANRNMLYELFYNLIDNGIKYNKPQGAIAVSIESRWGQAIIQVADTGIGIAPEHLDRIFERFYRVDKSRSRKTGGTGLGLAIVKNIARHHKGHVEVESTPGEGTCIRVILPQETPPV